MTYSSFAKSKELIDLSPEGIQIQVSRELSGLPPEHFEKGMSPFRAIALSMTRQLISSGKLRMSEDCASRIDIAPIVDLGKIPLKGGKKHSSFERAMSTTLVFAMKKLIRAETAPGSQGVSLENSTAICSQAISELVEDLLDNGNFPARKLSLAMFIAPGDDGIYANVEIKDFEVSLVDWETLEPIPALDTNQPGPSFN